MTNKRFTFRAWTGREMIYFKLGDDLPANWSYWDSCMQNTNLLDKNGKEIYEGDILSTEGKSFEVKFSPYYGWAGALMEGESFERWEVIGNVWENPELLK